MCKQLGLPLHPKKCKGPSTSLVVLGIHLDSVTQTVQLPPDKLESLWQLIDSWMSRHWCNRQLLEYLTGHLHHAAKVVWPSRTFIRCMIDLLRCFRRRDHPMHLNKEFELYLQWWHQFLLPCHGVTFWLFPGLSPTVDLEVTSNAEGAGGYGAYYQTQWFNGLWPANKSPSQSHTRSCFPWLLQCRFGGWNGSRSTFSSVSTKKLSYLSLMTGHQGCLN